MKKRGKKETIRTFAFLMALLMLFMSADVTAFASVLDATESSAQTEEETGTEASEDAEGLEQENDAPAG